MKGKRYTTEEKIRILREADRGEKSIQDIYEVFIGVSRWEFERDQSLCGSEDGFTEAPDEVA